MIEYHEHAPSPRLSRYVECFWNLRAFEDEPAYPVLPDGCADIIFSRSAGAADLNVVGPMTSRREFHIPRGQELFGVRFRPGMWGLFVPARWAELTDDIVQLDDTIDRGGKRLLEDLSNGSSVQDMAATVEAWLGSPREETNVHRIAEHIAQQHGLVRIDDVAHDAGVSPRQLLRLFVSQTGLTPKQLCRVLRFRHSLQRLRRSARGTRLALECGYYDQAHWINEFRDFSGYTPGQYLAKYAIS